MSKDNDDVAVSLEEAEPCEPVESSRLVQKHAGDFSTQPPNAPVLSYSILVQTITLTWTQSYDCD